MDQPVAIQKKATTKRPSKKMRDLTQTQRKRIIHGTGEGGNDAAPSLKIGGVNISSKEACDGPCADKKCPAAQQLTIRAKGEEAATVTMWNVRHCPK